MRAISLGAARPMVFILRKRSTHRCSLRDSDTSQIWSHTLPDRGWCRLTLWTPSGRPAPSSWGRACTAAQLETLPSRRAAPAAGLALLM